MEMNYTEQAKKILAETNTICKIEFSHKGICENWSDEKKLRNIYNITLENNRHKYTFKFYDSIYNTENRDKLLSKNTFYYGNIELMKARKQAAANNNYIPTEYSILAYLTKYDSETFQDFCDEFGYDSGSRKAEKIYFDVQEEWRNIRKLFTMEQLEKLRDIQ